MNRTKTWKKWLFNTKKTLTNCQCIKINLILNGRPIRKQYLKIWIVFYDEGSQVWEFEFRIDVLLFQKHIYCKLASSRLSRLVAYPRVFRLFMKEKFDPYALWPLAKKVQNWIVDRSTARVFTIGWNFLRFFSIFDNQTLRLFRTLE